MVGALAVVSIGGKFGWDYYNQHYNQPLEQQNSTLLPNYNVTTEYNYDDNVPLTTTALSIFESTIFKVAMVLSLVGFVSGAAFGFYYYYVIRPKAESKAIERECKNRDPSKAPEDAWDRSRYALDPITGKLVVRRDAPTTPASSTPSTGGTASRISGPSSKAADGGGQSPGANTPKGSQVTGTSNAAASPSIKGSPTPAKK